MLLNFAGVLAPLVALVPTDRAPTDCHPVLDTANRDLNIANNVGALFVVAAVALIMLGVVAALQAKNNQPPDRPSWIAYLIVLAFYVVTLIVFLAGRTWFMQYAHPISAITMFALLAINALVNGYNLYETRKNQDPSAVPQKRRVRPFNTYTAIGTLMVVAALVIWIFLRPHWHQWVFGLEATEIGLFAAFWLEQTIELWDEGLRPKPAPGAQTGSGLDIS
jgi:Ca2+/Na+ antiporter